MSNPRRKIFIQHTNSISKLKYLLYFLYNYNNLNINKLKKEINININNIINIYLIYEEYTIRISFNYNNIFNGCIYDLAVLISQLILFF